MALKYFGESERNSATIGGFSCGDENDCLNNTSNLNGTTGELIKTMVSQVVLGNWENLSYPLSEWQRAQLENLDESGVTCLLKMWLIEQKELIEGT